jgi:hypothetical protein
VQSRKNKGLQVLLWELSDDEDTMMDTGLDVPDDPQQHGFMITMHIWMFLSKCQKVGVQSSGGV